MLAAHASAYAGAPGVSPADLQNLVLGMERHRLTRVSSRE
jgi:hypothetical protein